MLFRVNPINPQLRLIRKVVDVLNRGDVIALPTDTVYAFGCRLMDKKAIEKLYFIKRVDKRHPMALLCADLKHISVYARVSNPAYKSMRHYLPGPYTFILEATRKVPKIMLTRQRTVGIRVPDNVIVQDLVRELGEPILTTSAEVTDYGLFTDPHDIEDRFGKQLGCVIDGGAVRNEESTVVDLSVEPPVILRKGKDRFFE